MSLEKFAEIYRRNGIEVNYDGKYIYLEFGILKARARLDEEWLRAIKSYFRARQYEFNTNARMLAAYRSVEFQIVRVDSAFLPRPEHEFLDDKGNKVTINMATYEYALALLDSEVGEDICERVKSKMSRRSESRALAKGEILSFYKFDEILIVPYTAKYEVNRKLKRDTLVERGRESIKSCLFKLAYAYDEAWELRENIKRGPRPDPRLDNETDKLIPKARYKEDLVTFYKIAIGSRFPNQEFLSFYHILEYFFLRVSDEILMKEVKLVVNSITFNSSYENINRLVSVIKKNDKRAEEKEMLNAVLKKYVNEQHLVDFITSIEKAAGKQIYTDKKKSAFGEKIGINLELGHALSSTGRALKHLRNALVHSSDRYNREECYLPFSETEDIITEYIPIIRFLAESVISATAE